MTARVRPCWELEAAVVLLGRRPASPFLVSDGDASTPQKTWRVVLEARLAASPRGLASLRDGRNADVAVAQTTESRALAVSWGSSRRPGGAAT